MEKENNNKYNSQIEHSYIASEKIFNLFIKYKSKQFIFVEPGGNYGDYLIYKGAEKLANLAEIQFQSINHEEFMNSDYSKDTVTYIHGSGGFTPLWSGTPLAELRKAARDHKGITILGPSTFLTDPTYLNETFATSLTKINSQKLFLFTRDLISYEKLKECLPPSLNVCLDHDTAFNLRINDLLNSKPVGKYTLYCIRKDKESINIQDDASLSGWLDPVRYCKNFNHWVFLHSRAKQIITSRLHSAILGSILGIPTTLIPNNYHKNRSVWEYSLRQRGVQWSDNIPIGKTSRTVNKIYPLKKLLALSKFQGLLREFYGIR